MSANPEASNMEAVTQEVSHETTLFAEPILQVGNFTITNSLIMSWATVLILVVFFVIVGRKVKKVPGLLQNLFEYLLEQALELADSITGSRHKSERLLPVVMSLFFFILINNWLGLLPGVGTIGFIESEGGHQVFVPLLRGATADLNTTLAISLFAIILSHAMGVISLGLWRHFNKFVNVSSIAEMPKKIIKEPLVLALNPIKAFVGLIELIGEFAKVASLSFRLFGNILAGEVLLSSMMALFAYIVPLPFMFLEVMVGVIQALVFSILTLTFMSLAMDSHDEH
ncbi:F0F1 ATP synthase subunit A [Candidatus Falkowbacteria bacterium]|nr:F0F1 ATP synthase subunit A [Candidatus Falkowbacteria bacterium]